MYFSINNTKATFLGTFNSVSKNVQWYLEIIYVIRKFKNVFQLRWLTQLTHLKLKWLNINYFIRVRDNGKIVIKKLARTE